MGPQYMLKTSLMGVCIKAFTLHILMIGKFKLNNISYFTANRNPYEKNPNLIGCDQDLRFYMATS